MSIIYPNGSVTFTAPASSVVALYSDGDATISKQVGYPNVPTTVNQIATISSGRYTTSVFSAATVVIIEAGAAPVFYEVGTDAVVKPVQLQSTPGVLNATGALTAAMLLSGIVTSTTGAAVAGTIPTGTVMDAASTWAIGDAFDWAVITTGANAFTVTAASGHTVVGNMVVAAGKAGLFRTRKTAANTFVTYSLANT